MKPGRRLLARGRENLFHTDGWQIQIRERRIMASLNLTRKLHNAIDIGIGLLIGWYRVRIDGPRPGRNENAHYIYSPDDLKARLDSAATGPLNATSVAIMQTAAALLHKIKAPEICDFGGAYGEDYFRFRRFIPDATYTVAEIPEIVAAAKNVPDLEEIRFSTKPPAVCDLFFSCGVVMNAHEALFSAIEEMKPPRVIIGSVEISDEPTYWSMLVYRKSRRRCSYITFNRAEFISRFEGMGYRLHNSWRQGENTSGVFLNGQQSPDGYTFVFLKPDISL